MNGEKLTISSKLFRSLVTICGWGPYMRHGSSCCISAYSSSLSSFPEFPWAPFAALFSAAISLSICLSIWTSIGASIPNFAPRLATSSKQRITCRSFLRIIRSSVSNNRHSMIPKLLRHQPMKLDTLSRAKKVPAFAFGKKATSLSWLIGTARDEVIDRVIEILRAWRRATYSAADLRTLFACWEHTTRSNFIVSLHIRSSFNYWGKLFTYYYYYYFNCVK